MGRRRRRVALRTAARAGVAGRGAADGVCREDGCEAESPTGLGPGRAIFGVGSAAGARHALYWPCACLLCAPPLWTLFPNKVTRSLTYFLSLLHPMTLHPHGIMNMVVFTKKHYGVDGEARKLVIM